jgi:hypothetical protein
MKKIIMSLFTIVMVVGLSNNLNAQNTTTVLGDVSAIIITPITITNTNDLNFGAIVDGTGTVTMSTAGVRTTDYQAFAGNQAGTVTAASFDIAGQGAYTYAITLPTDDVTLTESGSGTMTVNSFVSNPSGTGTLTAGAGSVLVGATLNVVQGQETGVYDGSFDVTVAYN